MHPLLASLFIGLAVTSAAQAQQAPAAAPPQPCATPQDRQLDFWVGDWTFGEVGANPAPSNRITRDEFGSCAIVEHFLQPGGRPDGSDYIGGSYSMYDPQTSLWRQMWVDNNGSSFQLIGGPVTGQAHIFEFVTTKPIGAATKAYSRMIFENVQENSFDWRWQSQNADGSWTDRWVLNYRRKTH
ncbi:MAG: hypothetical protein SGJ21_16295 [Alphaproteobacteria bacterium]|nr:hypothetical protein [Alphaproteobacteria bacterium]